MKRIPFALAFRTLIPVLIFSALLLGACHGLFDTCVEGNGTIVQQDLTLSPAFHSIRSTIPCDLVLRQGAQDVKLEAESNLLDLIQIGSINGSLEAEGKGRSCFSTQKSIVLYVTNPEFRQIILNGSGNFTSLGSLDLEDLELSLSGAYNGSMKGSAKTVEIQLSGSGNIDLRDLACTTAQIRLSGSGNIWVNASDKLEVTITGSGNIYYAGDPDLKTTITGNGNVIKI